MRNVRQILDTPVAEAGGYAGRTVADQSLLNAQRAGANAIRSELARQSPELDSLNKQYNFWSKVKEVSEASTDRKVGQKGLLRPAVPTLLGSAGIAYGGVAGGMESLPLLAAVGAYTTPIGKTLRATGKASLARTLSGADIGSSGRLLQRSDWRCVTVWEFAVTVNCRTRCYRASKLLPTYLGFDSHYVN